MALLWSAKTSDSNAASLDSQTEWSTQTTGQVATARLDIPCNDSQALIAAAHSSGGRRSFGYIPLRGSNALGGPGAARPLHYLNDSIAACEHSILRVKRFSTARAPRSRPQR